jgi:C1A family cysteine protease
MPNEIRGFGWIRDLPDHRDFRYAAAPQVLQILSPSVDLRPACPAVYDQGDLGSCTANAIAGAIEFDLLNQQQPSFTPSRLFIYYNERVIEKNVRCDTGAQIRDGMKSVVSQGACPENMWPYVIDEWSDQPPDSCYQTAQQHRAIQYQSLMQDLNQMKACLASGRPFIFGFTVYDSFRSVGQTGHATVPGPGEGILGGHAVLAVGYDDSQQWFIVRNSWGANWGLQGYFTMPYAYLLQSSLSADFWMIQTVQ